MTVLEFARYRPHARASADAGSAWAGIAASASKVISGQSSLAARPTISGQRPGGSPRVRQPLTVEGDKPSCDETVPVPPSRSMTASDESDMDAIIVRNLRTCQAFATCETTLAVENGQIGLMGDSVRTIANRLIRTRIALGYANQADFAKKLGVGKNVYNPFEKAKRRITIDVALKIRDEFDISLDWIYCGDVSSLSVSVYKKISLAA